MTDDELMIRLQKGDQRAFQSLFDRHANRVLGYSARMLGDLSKAEDVAQDAWIRVVRFAENYEGKGQFKAWLMTLTRNAALNHLRRQSRWNTEVGQENEVTLNKEDLTPVQIEEELDRKGQLEEVKKAIDALPNNQRVALVMYMTEDMSYEEIGKEMDLSLGAIKSLIFRARKTLEQVLEQ
tara:strand:- start:62648 stop:63190 length:543 start_codon:yes stop_codon:yes gene_type:complete